MALYNLTVSHLRHCLGFASPLSIYRMFEYCGWQRKSTTSSAAILGHLGHSALASQIPAQSGLRQAEQMQSSDKQPMKHSTDAATARAAAKTGG